MKTKIITHHRKLSGTQQQDRCQQAAQKILKLLVSGWLLITASQAWALSYTITDLGTRGGAANTINNSGQIAGYSYDSGYSVYYAFLYSDGSMIDLGTLGGSTSNAHGINNSGQVVGDSRIAGDTSWHAFLYSNGSMIDLGTLGGFVSNASDINISGQIVGDSRIAGNAGPHAFLYSNGSMIDLGTLGGIYSWASAINDSGQVVGRSSIAGDDNTHHAFLYSNGSMVDLGTLGGTFSRANSINNSGQVVGISQITGDTDSRAFLYSDGSMVDLNSLLPANSAWMVYEALDINDLGQIVGTGVKDGTNRTFLLSPVFDLNIGRSGTGSGTVTSEDGKINCGATCSASYDVRSIINLIAVPDVGSTFAGWSPTSCGTSFPIVSDTTCTANFDLAGPALSINNMAKKEGNKGTTNFTFTVTLSSASTQKVTVQYKTADGTATAGYDYTSTSGTLTFKAGQTSKAVTVKVFGDKEKESDETFVVNLSNASKGATIRIGQGIGSIVNDDGL